MRPTNKFYATAVLAGALLASLAAPRRAAAQEVVLTGNDPVLRVQTGGWLPVDATVETKILFKRQSIQTKVTVQTACPGQSFFLAVTALSPTAGYSAGPVLLRNGMAPTDLIVHVPSGTRREQARLLYVASATDEQGNSDQEGADVHVVTYTIVQE
ncbi:MAG TPA: hypothetical protein VFG50_00995 [Rhodothermales bacterium]|nr:hypothetical protein [Rhodothermales bacterium]